MKKFDYFFYMFFQFVCCFVLFSAIHCRAMQGDDQREHRISNIAHLKKYENMLVVLVEKSKFIYGWIGSFNENNSVNFYSFACNPSDRDVFELSEDIFEKHYLRLRLPTRSDVKSLIQLGFPVSFASSCSQLNNKLLSGCYAAASESAQRQVGGDSGWKGYFEADGLLDPALTTFPEERFLNDQFDHCLVHDRGEKRKRNSVTVLPGRKRLKLED